MKKRLKKAIQRVLTISTLMTLLLANQVFATVNEADVIRELGLRDGIIDVIKVILLFIAVIGIGFEFIINRKKEEERSKTLESVPYAIGGVIIIVFGLQLVQMIM